MVYKNYYIKYIITKTYYLYKNEFTKNIIINNVYIHC
jgi:hypothetical protein